MHTRKLAKKSRRLSWLLRHGAAEAGVRMDAAGWVDRGEVCRATHLTWAEVHEVVRRNDKQRYQLDGDRIRASQGHSLEGMPVTREALEDSWERVTLHDPVWHGTTVEAVEGIARHGILPVRRTHVHLAASQDSHVGKRASVGLLLEVSPGRLGAAGIDLFRSPNGVLLARCVPPDALVGLVTLSRRARRSRDRLLATLQLQTPEIP